MIPFTGEPLTGAGRMLESYPSAQLVAKAFLAAWTVQIGFTFGPMMADPASIIIALTRPEFDYAFFNGALGKGIVAAWTITMSNPLEKTSTPTTLQPGPRLQDLKDK